MALPKIDVPIYTVNLLSNGKPIRFKPFTVKEQKLFLMAAESEDVDTSINTIRQVLQNCIIDDIDVDSLPVFDIENLFLNLRARSVGEIVNVRYRCNNEVEDENGKHACGNVIEYDFNILDVKTDTDPNHSNKIEITDKLGIVMKYPTFELLSLKNEKSTNQTFLDMIVDCVEYIYDDEQIYYSKDITRQELIDFIDSLQSKDLDKIQNFFDTMPRIKKTIDFKCNKCGYEEQIDVEGTDSFFV